MQTERTLYLPQVEETAKFYEPRRASPHRRRGAHMEMLLGMPLPVSPSPFGPSTDVFGYNSMYGNLAGPFRFLSCGSRFSRSTLLSISSSRSLNRSNAASALASDVHSDVLRWPRYTSSEECLDNTSSSETPMMVCIWLVTVWMKASSGSLFSSLYSFVPRSGMRRRLTVGRFGRYPAYEYCPKLTAACSADAIQMMVVQDLVSSWTVSILGHQFLSLRSPCPTSRTSFHHACSSASPCSTSSLG
ncbi:hypothetical protein EJB05_05018, partial [Eragrostis curvula]